jgi:hypothetical protein
MSVDDSKTSRRAAARAAQAAERARAQRRGRLLRALGIVVAALAVIVIVAIVAALRTTHTAATTSASNSVVSKVTSVPTSAFNAVGPGTIQVRPRAVTGAPALKDGSKPRVVYAGAEYCPYCAAERWAVVAALSRFGTFKDLGETTSSAQDVFPSTPTLSFHGSSYTSDYLSFSGTEMQSNQRVGNTYAPLDKLSSADEKLLNTYDTDKYTGAGSGSIPFLDLGGRFITAGASYTPQLFAGLTHQQVADKLADPTSPIAKAVDGTANVFTADLCQLTGNKPAAVCSSPGVTAAR